MRARRSLFGLLFGLCSAAIVLAAEAPPVTIEADHAVFEEQQGRSTYRGHVVVTRDGLEIRADQVTVVTDADGALQRVQAQGAPVTF